MDNAPISDTHERQYGNVLVAYTPSAIVAPGVEPAPARKEA